MNNKVWTFTINKKLNESELINLLAEGKKFTSEWTAHEQQLQASFEILNERIIVVKVNEDFNAASGCSIDKLTRFMKTVGTNYNFEPLNRLLVAIKKDDQVEIVHSSKIKDLLQQKNISENTLVYNTSVANETEFNEWEKPLKDTWLSKYLA
jgi:sulfur carrier protein ThiS